MHKIQQSTAILIGRWLANFMQMLTQVIVNERATSLNLLMHRLSLFIALPN